MKSTPAPVRSAFGLAVLILFAATVVAVVWARIRLAGLPLERDEGEYGYMGQLLLQGVPPYKLAYSMKFPGTAAVYAVLMSIFGQTATGIHLGLVFANLITIGLIVLLGRRLLGFLGGVAAGASYSVFSLMPHVLGQAAHATHFVVLFAIAGSLVLLRALDRQSPSLIFGSGALFGVALLMKQPGVFFVLFSALYLAASDWRSGIGIKKTLLRSLLLISGTITVFLLTAAALWICGVFGKFWFWTIQYATRYGTQVSLGDGLQIFIGHFTAALGTAWPLWAIAAVGFIACLARSRSRIAVRFLAPFALFSAMAVCPGLYFRPHYFILFLPAVSLFVAVAVVRAVEQFQNAKPALTFAALLIFATSLAWPLLAERDFFFERSIAEANRMVNGTNPFPESIKIADFLRSKSPVSDTIAVLGSEPQIYFYSQRHSATGYIYTYSLMEPQPYAHQMQQEMIAEIEAARPKFLVLIGVDISWLPRAESDQTIFRWAARYCDANYDRVGLVNIFDEGTDYYLSGKPPNVTSSPEHIVIYRRKT